MREREQIYEKFGDEREVLRERGIVDNKNMEKPENFISGNNTIKSAG